MIVRSLGLASHCKNIRLYQQFKCVHLSTRNQKGEEDYNETSSTILYKAQKSRANFPRGILAFSALNSAYWTWYVVDFAPTIQSTTGVTAAQADNTVGYLGLGLSIFMSLGSMLYPKSLIHEIALVKKNNIDDVLAVKTYNIPLVLPSKSIIYPLGNIVIDSPNDVTKIISEYNGDIGRFPGHLALHAENKYTNLLINFDKNSSNEVFNKDLLLKCLTPGMTTGTTPIVVLNDENKVKPLKKKVLIKKKRR